MASFGPFIVLIFMLGFHSPLIGGESDTISAPANSTAIHAPSDNILDFLEAVKSSAKTIESQIDVQATQSFIRMGSKIKLQGASLNDFLFSASIVRESATKVLSLANNLRRKIEAIETEKNLRLFATRLVARGNQTSLNNWLDSKANEITEAVMNLTMHYSELSESYQSHLNTLEVLKRRIAVEETYVLLGNHSDGDNDDSNTEICRNGMFRCGNGARNITCVKYCNGYSECEDESDEPPGCANQFGSNCSQGNFRCDDGQCTHLSSRCSSYSCGDRSHFHYC